MKSGQAPDVLGLHLKNDQVLTESVRSTKEIYNFYT